MANKSYYPVRKPDGTYTSVCASSLGEAYLIASKFGGYVTNTNTSCGSDTDMRHRTDGTHDYAPWYNGRKF